MELKQLTEQFESALGEIKGLLDTQNTEIAKTGEVSEKTASAIAEVEGRIGEYSEQIKELGGRLDDMEVKLDRPVLAGNSEGGVKSLGDTLVSSEAFSDMKARGERTSAPIQVKSFAPFIGRKALTSDAGSGAALINPMRVAGVMEAPPAPPRLRSLIPTVPMQGGSVEFVKETNFFDLYTVTTASTTDKTLAVESVAGFYVGQVLEIIKQPSGAEVEEDCIIESINADDLEITLTIDPSGTVPAGSYVTAEDFIFTAEAKIKPAAEAEFSLVTEPAKTLAHWMPASRQILDDAAGLRAHIDQRLVEGLVFSEEKQLLYGAGTSTEISGILSDSDISLHAPSSAETRLDSLRKAMTLCSLAHMPADGIVLHPSDWEGIELEKDDESRYLWAGAPGMGAGPMVWRVPVVLTTAIDAGTALVGNFRMGCALHDREAATVRVSESHDNYFAKNMVAILAEERLAMCIYRPEAFCKVTFKLS
tara:strand:- start:6 stop:1439 length:1434 start_codon:yes stop_codon:yes gene_type:complete